MNRSVNGSLSRGALLAEWSESVLEPAARELMSRVNEWLHSRGSSPTLIGWGNALRLLCVVVRPPQLDHLVKKGARPSYFDVKAAFNRAVAFDPDLAEWTWLTGPHRGPRLNALRKV